MYIFATCQVVAVLLLGAATFFLSRRITQLKQGVDCNRVKKHRQEAEYYATKCRMMFEEYCKKLDKQQGEQ